MNILKLTPSCKDYLWGGSRLRSDFEIRSDLDPLAEAWVLSCHPDGSSHLPVGFFFVVFCVFCSSSRKGLLSVNCRRQALQFCLDPTVMDWNSCMFIDFKQQRYLVGLDCRDWGNWCTIFCHGINKKRLRPTEALYWQVFNIDLYFRKVDNTNHIIDR